MFVLLEIHESLIYSRFAISLAVLVSSTDPEKGVSYDEVCKPRFDYFV
jgi:hypothetical protein